MTRKEAIEVFNEPTKHIQLLKGEIVYSQFFVEALEMAIEALSAEPCDDAVSRQAALDINKSHHGQMPNHINHQIWEEINALPPVTPKPKMGQWINGECSICGEHAPYWILATTYYDSKYCPNCGHKMFESDGAE